MTASTSVPKMSRLTDSELIIYANQRIPGLERFRHMAVELREARNRIEHLEGELKQAKTAATYGAKMVADMRGMV